jgi:raffinose synthase
MFQSGHEWGAFHAAARAVSGGPVYVSDKPNEHDFSLLRKLVTEDGRVLRADRPGLPTRKVLFRDPTREPVLLEIWTRNGRAGLVGAFNCRLQEHQHGDVAGSIGPGDVPDLSGESFACFRHRANRLAVLRPDQTEPVNLGPGEFELFTLVPIERGFAAIGLADKYNSHGAVRATRFAGHSHVEVDLLAPGRFLAYSERAPLGLEVAGDPLDFEYDAGSCRLDAELPATMAGPLRVRFA